MELQIRSNGTKVTDGMREFIDRRMSKLDHLAERVVDAQLDLRTEHPRAGAPQTTAQLTLKTGQHLIRAEVRADDPAKAIDAAIDKLIRQVHKYNDKRQSRRRRAGEHPMNELVDVGELDLPDLLAEDDRDTGLTDNEGDERSIPLRIKRFGVKPMIVEEAVDQMELLGHDFFLFHNADESQLNVVYKRRDGAYGLLAPNKT